MKPILSLQVARKSLHRQAVVLRLTQLQVLDGVMVTLEERTRAELLNAESPVSSPHSTHTQLHAHTVTPTYIRGQRLEPLGCDWLPLRKAIITNVMMKFHKMFPAVYFAKNCNGNAANHKESVQSKKQIQQMRRN